MIGLQLEQEPPRTEASDWTSESKSPILSSVVFDVVEVYDVIVVIVCLSLRWYWKQIGEQG